MKKIALYKDYGITDAGNEDKIKDIIDKILVDENQVELDLTRCMIDYPATSMLIDKILSDLTGFPNKKILIIKVSYFLPEQTLLNDLLGDSKFFEIVAKTEIPIKDLTEKIKNKLVPVEIALTVEILDASEKLRKKFSYGSK